MTKSAKSIAEQIEKKHFRDAEVKKPLNLMLDCINECVHHELKWSDPKGITYIFADNSSLTLTYSNKLIIK